MSDIEQKVKEIIVDKLTVDENEVTPTAEFNKDLGADSLDTVELIMEFGRASAGPRPRDQLHRGAHEIIQIPHTQWN